MIHDAFQVPLWVMDCVVSSCERTLLFMLREKREVKRKRIMSRLFMEENLECPRYRENNLIKDYALFISTKCIETHGIAIRFWKVVINLAKFPRNEKQGKWIAAQLKTLWQIKARPEAIF